MVDQNKGVSRLRLSGSDLRQMLAVGTALLQESLELVNGLNVFPVPDGDTGTNMLLTMQSALEEVAKVGSNDFGAVAHAAAHGSLMGARGNSGVILSQVLRGIARSAGTRSSLDAAEWALALREGANTAYRGIGKPVEGTILTVARESAEAGVAASQQERSISAVLASTVEAARRSLENTPNLLPILRDAGVVDAGGQGYVLVLEGAEMFFSGKRAPALAALARKPAPQSPAPASTSAYGYCTELLVRGENLQVDRIREQLEALGTSVIVVGDPEMIHLHVHSRQPGDVLNLGCSLGSLDRVKIENMEIQHTAYLAGRNAADIHVLEGIGVVAVAAGPGLSQLFQDLGAAAVVHGGQTMNPSIEEMVHGVDFARYSRVILLPNNPNVLLTAQQAQALARTELRVVPTRTVCEGVAAMVAFNAQLDLEANVAAMSEAAAAVQSIELTRAVRSTRVNGLEVVEGQAIGLLNGALVEVGDSLEEVARKALERAGAAEHEVVTIYRGEGVSPSEGEALASSIRELWPAVEVEVVMGGQPHYPYIVSVE